MPDAGGRKRYSRDDVLACKKTADLIKFRIPPPLIQIPRGSRKKSQSNDTDGCPPSVGSREALAAEEVEPLPHWRRTNRQQFHANGSQQPGHYLHPRPRNPSGSHGDTNQAGVSATLRLNPTESRRETHGDWSKGCAGWRQRSHSGSEQSTAITGHKQNAPSVSRGRGGVKSGNTYSESDDHVFRGSGRGRYGGRNSFPHRGFTSRGHYPGVGGYRPSGLVSGSNPLNESEVFWQDDDWYSTNFEQDARITGNAKSSLPSDPKNCTDSSAVSCHPPCTPPSVDVIAAERRTTRAYSESCCLDPPPGFDLPHKQIVESAAGEHTTTVSSTPSDFDPTHLASSMPAIDVSNSPWYYIDSTGQTQGPFGNQQMATWLANGYLPFGIEIRRECDECFLTLVDHMSLAGRIPFWSGYNQPPVTRSNLSSILMSSAKHALSTRCLHRPTTSPPASSVPQPTSHIDNSPLFNPPSDTNIAPTTALISSTAEMAPHVQTGIPALSTFPTAVVEPFPLPSCISNADGFGITNVSTSDLPNPVVISSDSNSDLQHLYSEAQALASHVAKMNAERKELAAKLAAISLTAVKLLADESPPTAGDAAPPVSTGAVPLFTAPSSSTNGTFVEPGNQPVVTEHTDQVLIASSSESRSHEGYSNGLTNENSDGHLQGPEIESTTPGDILEAQTSGEPLNSCVSQPIDAPTAAMKKHKKNRKAKKKPTAEQERQLAWDAEFARRKASALAKRLAEESEAMRMAEEEAVSLSEQQIALIKEQKRMLAEQRKREAQRAKEMDQLGQLRLPESARWGIHAADTASPLTVSGCSNVASIQTVQTGKETRAQNQETLSTEQSVFPALEASVGPASHPPTQTVPVNSANRAVPNQSVAGKMAISKTTASSSKLEPAAVPKPLNRVDKPKPSAVVSCVSTVGDSKRVTGPTSPPSTSGTVTSSSLPATRPIAVDSIWNLPNDGKTALLTSAAKSSKKNKKKSSTVSQPTSEGVSFAAKEQLAHWCESQLSFMPLSGIDLPTLVDLLCELEGADQVVEFIEASLGRSKRTTKFSKAFLEKRACIRNTVR